MADATGGSLLALRLPAVLAGVGTMAFAALLVREWGGRWRAQLLAMLCLLLAPAYLRMAAMLDIPVVEVFLCTVAAYLVARALSRHERWTWIVAGAVLGLAALAKHSALVWGAALAIGVLATPDRRVLGTRWPWLGAGVALLCFLPNLVWQLENRFVTLEFLSAIRHEALAVQGRSLFVAGQLLYFHPLAVPVWLAGLVSAGRAQRPFAALFLAMFLFFFVLGGKPNYLASAYPPVLASGAIALERALAGRTAVRRTFVALLSSSGAAFALLALPILPLQTVDAAIERLFGWAVPPMALTHDMHAMQGWQEHVATIGRVYRSLPTEDRARATILAGSYSQAAALNVLGDARLPRALSGHMTYHLWGPGTARGEVLIAYGVPLGLLERHYRRCLVAARIDAPLARPWDTNLPVHLCREPLGTLADVWPELRDVGGNVAAENPP
jgi:hypothetical protein